VFRGQKSIRDVISPHTEKIRNTTRGCRLWEVKNSGCENSSPTEVKRHFHLSKFVNCHNKKYAKFLSNQKLSTKPAHLHLSFGTFISNLCSVHFPFVAISFTSLAYEIFYARKVDLFDKIKEVVFSQLFPCVTKPPINSARNENWHYTNRVDEGNWEVC
jgi:hypothetical protein